MSSAGWGGVAPKRSQHPAGTGGGAGRLEAGVPVVPGDTPESPLPGRARPRGPGRGDSGADPVPAPPRPHRHRQAAPGTGPRGGGGSARLSAPPPTRAGGCLPVSPSFALSLPFSGRARGAGEGAREGVEVAGGGRRGGSCLGADPSLPSAGLRGGGGGGSGGSIPPPPPGAAVAAGLGPQRGPGGGTLWPRRPAREEAALRSPGRAVLLHGRPARAQDPRTLGPGRWLR